MRYVALLYSVVLPGRRVTAADLIALAERAGLRAPRPLLATGNLLFEADEEAMALERRLEAVFRAELGKPHPIIIRCAADWLRLVAGNPFPAESAADGSAVAVRVQRDRLGPEALALLSPYRSAEKLALVDGDLWVSSPAAAPTRLSAALTPRRLGIGTTRNWNTVRRIADALAG